MSEAQGLWQMEDENRRLKALVADLSLNKEALKAVIPKNGWSLPVVKSVDFSLDFEWAQTSFFATMSDGLTVRDLRFREIADESITSP